MELQSAVVLAVDGWGAGFLGPYGNTWIETPECNRLAAQSLLCETVISDSPNLATVYHSYWSGRHACAGGETPAERTLPALARQAGLRTILVTDSPLVADLPLASPFTERVTLPRPCAVQPVNEVEDTAFFQIFQAARETLARQREPFLLWIHASGMAGPWDAPLEFRNQFADEDDPLPGDFAGPPELEFPENFDPDDLLGAMHAYGGQVSLLDLCVGSLLDAVQQHPLADRTLLSLTSPRGYPLGEHRRLGWCDNALYSELLQTPLLVRYPDGAGRLERTQEIFQPADLFAGLAAFLKLGPGFPSSRLDCLARGEEHRPGEIACAAAPGQRAIRTPAWFLRESNRDGATWQELFTKPDDRWEVNEISSRGGDAPALLVDTLAQFQAAALANNLAAFAPLPELLRNIFR